MLRLQNREKEVERNRNKALNLEESTKKKFDELSIKITQKIKSMDEHGYL